MPKSYKVGDTTYRFPDDFDDTKVQGILAQQGIIPAQKPESGSINPDDTFAPGANRWLKESFPTAYSVMEGLMTAIPRGAEQVARAIRPGRKPAERVSDVIEGTMTAAGPTLLAVPGTGAVRRVAAGIGAGMLAQGGTEATVEALGAEPETAQAAGDVAGLAAGYGMTAMGPRISQAIGRGAAQVRNAASVATDPAVVRAGVEVLPGGKSAIKFYDLVKAKLQQQAGEVGTAQPDDLAGYYAGQAERIVPRETPLPEPAAVAAPVLQPAPVVEPPPAIIAPEAARPLTALEETSANFTNRPQWKPTGNWRDGLSADIVAKIEAQHAAKQAKRAGEISPEPPVQPKPWFQTSRPQSAPARKNADIVAKVEAQHAAKQAKRAGEISPEPPVQPKPARKSGNRQGGADALALTEKLLEWKFTPDEAMGMGRKSWEKAAHDAGVKAPSIAVQRNAVFQLKKAMAGQRTIPELMQGLRTSLAGREK